MSGEILVVDGEPEIVELVTEFLTGCGREFSGVRSHLHSARFDGIAGVLSERASTVFRFMDQARKEIGP